MKELLKSAAYRSLYVLRNLLNPPFRFQEIAILCYHSISDINIDTAIAPAVFERQLAYLNSHGHLFISLADIVEWRNGKKNLPCKAVALTFDDGYADFETAALPILQKFRAPATLFVLGNGAASRAALGNDIPLLFPDALARVHANPLIEIGFHSATHANLSKLSGPALEAECQAPFPARFFAYPGGNHSPAATQTVEKLGYIAACSIRQTLVTKKSNVFLLPRSVITRGMPLWQVELRTTKAIFWYRALVGLFRA
jgi:peptidoglycan/xylan/chitin deacetylase (PgdA/CDA1 family)